MYLRKMGRWRSGVADVSNFLTWLHHLLFSERWATVPQTTSKGSRSRDLVSAGSELLSPYRAKRNVVIKKSLGSVFRWTASIVRWIYSLEAPSPESTFACGQKCASLPVLLVDYVVVPSFHSLGMVSVLLNPPFICFIWSRPFLVRESQPQLDGISYHYSDDYILHSPFKTVYSITKERRNSR